MPIVSSCCGFHCLCFRTRRNLYIYLPDKKNNMKILKFYLNGYWYIPTMIDSRNSDDFGANSRWKMSKYERGI